MASRMRAADWLREHAEAYVLRGLLAALVTATAVVLAVDFSHLSAAVEDAIGPLAPTANPGIGPADPTQRRNGQPSKSMTFDLIANGRLMATGPIAPGTAKVFAKEIAKRGSYVRSVVLDSPGGSVSDALAMGRLIREKRFATEVEASHTCASSCPLVFAGGIERRAGRKAAIGVHQIFGASGSAASSLGPDGAQRASAECQRYLREMGVDLQVWLHAMETPKEGIYYFSPDELITLKLATQYGDQPARQDVKS